VNCDYEQGEVKIELFGVPRLRAGRSELSVRAANVAQALERLEQQCPALAGSVVADGRLLSAYRLSLNGRTFVTDLSTPLSAGDSLVLIAADAGG
jgi:molybdopterin converting factor small subunit